MCGIVGIYNFKRKEIDASFIDKCVATMRHRGPDKQTVWTNNSNYITGFARLAIRDLSNNGDQPMISDCGNFCITFNGEIYNTVELKNLLLPFISSYKSTSDTEVLLYALIYLGFEKTLSLADGIFAFAFYDIKQNSLLLVRDRIGVKPLYVGVSGEEIIYSSQYDHIVNHPSFSKQTIDERAIGNFLQLGYISENFGAYKNTKLLKHGFYYIANSKGFHEKEYYCYPVNNMYADKNYLENYIDESVKKQLVSDVALGTFMSGGVDSTLVTYFANEEKKINTFTIGIKDSELDESSNADAFAKIFGTAHHHKYFSQKDLLALINENTIAYSEPFADVSSLPVLMLSRFAREKVTVALSGDGGDELFWGYPRHFKMLNHLPSYKKSKFSRRVNLLKNKISTPGNTDLARHWSEDDFFSYAYHSLFITGALEQQQKFFNADAYDAFAYENIKLLNAKKNIGTAEMMNMVRKLEMDIHLQRILLKVDRASMFHSLEVRVPLLSNKMLDISTAFTFNDCIKNKQGKINLKEILAKKSNEQLVMLPKKGFAIPIDEWIRKEIKHDVEDKIMHMPPALATLFNRKALEKMFANHIANIANNGWLLWAIYSLVNWHSFHVKKFKN